MLFIFRFTLRILTLIGKGPYANPTQTPTWRPLTKSKLTFNYIYILISLISLCFISWYQFVRSRCFDYIFQIFLWKYLHCHLFRKFECQLDGTFILYQNTHFEQEVCTLKRKLCKCFKKGPFHLSCYWNTDF